MSLKKKILILHKILGLATGIVVFIVAITGCCWAFKDEIESLYDDYKYVEKQDNPILTPTQVKEIAQKILPNNSVHGNLYTNTGTEAIEVIFYDAEPEFYSSIYIHPYSGEVLKVKNHIADFFGFILKGHIRLWLPKAIGEQVVGASILLFLIIIISGFILWMPKKKKNLKQRITFDWKKTTRWKRKNFDLHTVIGFYASVLAFVIAFTGLVMAYNWFYYVFYKSIGGQRTSFFEIPKNSSKENLNENDIYPIDLIIPKLKQENPEALSFEVHYPHDKEESIYVEVSNSEGLHYDADYRFFDQNTLQEIESDALYSKYKNAKLSDKIMRMNYDIHIGSIGGIVGKIIAFLVSLAIASLPVSGVLLWYGRNYKKKKTSV